MAVNFPVRMSNIRSVFGGNGRASEYLRNGALVPSNSTTGAISTERSGWRFRQFNGADKNTAPPPPLLQEVYSSDQVFASAGGASAVASVIFQNDGRVAAYAEQGGTGYPYTWLPAGRSAGEYQIRVSPWDTNSFGPWQSLGNSVNVCSANAWSDGFYSADEYAIAFVQLGYNGIALTGIVQCRADASAQGRG